MEGLYDMVEKAKFRKTEQQLFEVNLIFFEWFSLYRVRHTLRDVFLFRIQIASSYNHMSAKIM
jgi:hypothetical protein